MQEILTFTLILDGKDYGSSPCKGKIVSMNCGRILITVSFLHVNHHGLLEIEDLRTLWTFE